MFQQPHETACTMNQGWLLRSLSEWRHSWDENSYRFLAGNADANRSKQIFRELWLSPALRCRKTHQDGCRSSAEGTRCCPKKGRRRHPRIRNNVNQRLGVWMLPLTSLFWNLRHHTGIWKWRVHCLRRTVWIFALAAAVDAVRACPCALAAAMNFA